MYLCKVFLQHVKMGIFDKIASLILDDSASKQAELTVKKTSVEDVKTEPERPEEKNTAEQAEPSADVRPTGENVTADPEKKAGSGTKNAATGKVKQELDKLDENYIETSSRIIEAVERKLNQAYKGKKTDFSGKEMTLWITEAMLFETLDNDEYKAKFRLALSQEGYDFHNFEFCCKPLPADNMFTQIAGSVFMQIADRAVRSQIVRRRARISLAPGSRGSLKAEEYILDSGKMPCGDRFNIGRGCRPMPSRTNYIVIDENPAAKDYSEANGFVSRTHATIRFSPTQGFCLFVESGCYQNGNRTRVFRAGEPEKDLTNPKAPVPLKNGDIIELAKKMTLLFEEIDD